MPKLKKAMATSSKAIPSKVKAVETKAVETKVREPNRYQAIIHSVFVKHHTPGITEFEFTREEFVGIAQALNITPPKNVGDVVYSFRYRNELPDQIRKTASKGLEWIIEGAGRAIYRFKQVRLNRIEPREELLTIKVPDATPEIIGAYALSDEQALLAKVRYNLLCKPSKTSCAAPRNFQISFVERCRPSL